MKQKLIAIVAISLLLFLGVVFYQNYIMGPLSAYHAESVWKEYEQTLQQKKDSVLEISRPLGVVNDYGQVFSESQVAELTKMLCDYKVKTSLQIVLITVDSIEPYDNIKQYAADIGNKWGVGTSEKNNGLVIVICNPDRQIGIATGLGIEPILTDEICKEVIENNFIPEFKKEEIYIGVKNGINELIRRWR